MLPPPLSWCFPPPLFDGDGIDDAVGALVSSASAGIVVTTARVDAAVAIMVDETEEPENSGGKSGGTPFRGWLVDSG